MLHTLIPPAIFFSTELVYTMQRKSAIINLKDCAEWRNIMEKIASFTIDHIKLQPGVYVSRKDHIGAEVITTFDLRMTSPNEEPVMNTAEVHHRASGCNFPAQSSGIQGQDRLLRPHGMPYRLLSAAGRRSLF